MLLYPRGLRLLWWLSSSLGAPLRTILFAAGVLLHSFDSVSFLPGSSSLSCSIPSSVGLGISSVLPGWLLPAFWLDLRPAASALVCRFRSCASTSPAPSFSARVGRLNPHFCGSSGHFLFILSSLLLPPAYAAPLPFVRFRISLPATFLWFGSTPDSVRLAVIRFVLTVMAVLCCS